MTWARYIWSPLASATSPAFCCCCCLFGDKVLLYYPGLTQTWNLLSSVLVIPSQMQRLQACTAVPSHALCSIPAFPTQGMLFSPGPAMKRSGLLSQHACYAPKLRFGKLNYLLMTTQLGFKFGIFSLQKPLHETLCITFCFSQEIVK